MVMGRSVIRQADAGFADEGAEALAVALLGGDEVGTRVGA
jgi:hypothetical protein